MQLTWYPLEPTPFDRDPMVCVHLIDRLAAASLTIYTRIERRSLQFSTQVIRQERP